MKSDNKKFPPITSVSVLSIEKWTLLHDPSVCTQLFIAFVYCLGPPIPASLKQAAPQPGSSTAQADSDDDEIGPPLPPEMRGGEKKPTQHKPRDSDEESSDDEDDVRVSTVVTNSAFKGEGSDGDLSPFIKPQKFYIFFILFQII